MASAVSRSPTTSDLATWFTRSWLMLKRPVRRSPGAAETFCGGYAGVFLDPDGHAWEVSHNPGFTLGPDGALVLPDFGA